MPLQKLTQASIALADWCAQQGHRPDLVQAVHAALPNALTPKTGWSEPCQCGTCRPVSLSDPGSMRMVVCPHCGDKRCPHAKNHRDPCGGGCYELNAWIERQAMATAQPPAEPRR